MKYRPWPIVVLALLHILEPIGKIAFYSLYYEQNPLQILRGELVPFDFWHAFQTFALFPIAGIAIYKVKKWSLPVVFLVELWVIIANWSYFAYLYQAQSYATLGFSLFFAVLNLIVVAYFLIPAVRLTYFDPKIRWWEARPRYQADIDCHVGQTKKGTIRNMSQTGVFVAHCEDLPMGKTVPLKFEAQGMSFELQGLVVHHFAIDGVPGYGIQFQDVPHREKSKVKKLLRHWEKTGVARRPERRQAFKDFTRWLTSLPKNRDELLPRPQRGKGES